MATPYPIMRITVYDESRDQYRTFTVIPWDPAYTPSCKNRLHQAYEGAAYCGCTKIAMQPRRVPRKS